MAGKKYSPQSNLRFRRTKVAVYGHETPRRKFKKSRHRSAPVIRPRLNTLVRRWRAADVVPETRRPENRTVRKRRTVSRPSDKRPKRTADSIAGRRRRFEKSDGGGPRGWVWRRPARLLRRGILTAGREKRVPVATTARDRAPRTR